MLKGVAATVGLAPTGAAFAQASPAGLPPQAGDFLVATAGTAPLTPDDIRLDAAAFGAFAMSPEGLVRGDDFLNTVNLLRFDPASLSEETRTMGAEGVLGYTIICTHAGCPVSDRLDAGMIACDCHGSRFDPLENGKVVAGPAVRKLPQLAIEVREGKLVVTNGFDGRIGGDMIGDDDR